LRIEQIDSYGSGWVITFHQTKTPIPWKTASSCYTADHR
jgi:hypothetical protein